MERRNFWEYYREYGTNSIINFGKLFINWTEVHGYIPTNFGNTIYIFEHDKIEVTNKISFGIGENLPEMNEALLREIREIGYRSEIYKENSEKLIPIRKKLEKDFCNNFIEVLFPKANYNREMKEVEAEKVLLLFREEIEKNILRDSPRKLNEFMVDFELFLRKPPNSIPNGNEKFGYFFLKNIHESFQDFGVIIFSKSNLSEKILFYQINDNN